MFCFVLLNRYWGIHEWSRSRGFFTCEPREHVPTIGNRRRGHRRWRWSFRQVSAAHASCIRLQTFPAIPPSSLRLSHTLNWNKKSQWRQQCCNLFDSTSTDKPKLLVLIPKLWVLDVRLDPIFGSSLKTVSFHVVPRLQQCVAVCSSVLQCFPVCGAVRNVIPHHANLSEECVNSWCSRL